MSVAADPAAAPTLLTWPTIMVAYLATDRLAARDSLVLPSLAHLSDEEGWTTMHASTAEELHAHIDNAQNRPAIIFIVAHGNNTVDGGWFATAADAASPSASPVLTRDTLLSWLVKRRFSGGVGIVNCVCNGSFFSSQTGAVKVAWCAIDNFDKISREQFCEQANKFVTGIAKTQAEAATTKTEATKPQSQPQPRKSVCENLGCSVQ